MINPIVIGLAEVWGFGGQPDGRGEWDGFTHDVVLFTSGIALTHTARRCDGPCAIHGPSAHHMRDLPVFYREHRGIVERICPHGVGHPDPDQVGHWQKTLSETQASAQSIHGCCEAKCCEALREGEE